VAKKHSLARRISGATNVYKTQLQKLKDSKTASRVATAAKREAQLQSNVIASAAAAYALGYAKKNGMKLPTIGGIEPAILYGAILAYAGPKVAKGRNGQLVQAAGAGLLTVGAYQYARSGTTKLEGVSEPPQRGYFENSSDVEVDP
jgi:hypothetical protein